MRRGQLTIFFLLGLVILFAVALLFFVRTEITPQVADTQTTPQAEQYLISCMNDALYDWLDELATNEAVWLDSLSTSTDPDVNLSDVFYEDINERYRFTFDSKSPYDSYFARVEIAEFDRLIDGLNNSIHSNLTSCLGAGVDLDVGVPLSELEVGTIEITTTPNTIFLFADFLNADEQTRFAIERNHQIRLEALYNFVRQRIVFAASDPRIAIDDSEHIGHPHSFNRHRTGFIISPNSCVYTFSDSQSRYRGSVLEIGFETAQISYKDNAGAIHEPTC